MSHKIEAVIFDMDGVIVDSNPVHKKILQEFCEKYGKKLSDNYIRENLFGRTNQEWIPNVFGPLTDEQIEILADEKETLFRKQFNPKKYVVPGFIDFLNLIKQEEIQTVVATSAPPENVDYILDELSIKNLFEAVLDSSHFTKSKPHPEPYLKAAKTVGASIHNCIVFEDSISGVKSGLSAGAKVVGITTTHTRDELDLCHLVIDDFTKIITSDLEKLLYL